MLFLAHSIKQFQVKTLCSLTMFNLQELFSNQVWLRLF